MDYGMVKDLHEGGELQKNYTHIIHEVKTGNANVFEIYKQYAGMVYENATYDSSDRRRITGNVCGLDFLWIWGWKDLLDFSIPDNENPEIVKKFNIAFKQRRVRVLSLSLIVPIVNNALNKILF
jgi:hypothetical protein